MKLRHILFFLILLLCLGLRIIYLDKGYNSDEGWLLKMANLNLNKLIPSLIEVRGSTYPPLSPFLLHFWIKLNKSEIWVRSYFVFFGTALCILIYFLGKLYLDKYFGMIVFFLSAISPLLIWSSQFVRSYIDSAFWAILSIYFMLRILRGANFLKNSLGYIFSSVLALYSSYLNILILISESIFVFIYYFRDLKFLRKWLILKIVIIILFIPCLLILLKQFKLTTGIDAKWSERGFQLFGLSFGYHARSIIAVFGIDPGFLTIHPLSKELNKAILISLVGLSFFIISWFFIAAFKNLRRIIEKKSLIYFFLTNSIITIIVYDILVEFFYFPLHTRYFITQHILFLFVISSVIYSPQRNKKLNIWTLSFISLLYILRFPYAIEPEFETKKAYNFIVNNIKIDDCLLMARNINIYVDQSKKALNLVIMYKYIKKASNADDYEPLDEEAKSILLKIKEKHKDIWFCRLYGNDEILGANRLIMSWLQENGYTMKGIKKFKRIDIIFYKRLD